MPIAGAPSPRAPEEALAWLLARVPLGAAQARQLGAQVAQRAFTIAGVAQASVVADVLAALDQSLRDGSGLEEFKASVGDALESAWGSDGGRLATVFRTATQSAYNAGRYRQATDPDTLATRPFWRFVATLDARTAPECRAAHGTILPASDPWWQGHYPPLHHNCRCFVQTLTADRAAALGGPTAPGASVPQQGFGSPPL